MKNNMRNSKTIYISFPSFIAKKLEKEAKKRKLKKGDLLKIAFLEYLKNEEEEKKFKRIIQEKAKALGIKDEDDIESIIDSLRK